MGKLADKVALITGAARGQGAAEAQLFAAEGARVMLTDILDAEGAAVAADIGPQAAFMHHDVASKSDWERVVAETLARFGRIDILVNNAAIVVPGTIETTDLDAYMHTIMINQVGVFLGMKEAAPAIKRQGGAIVNISSLAGIVASPVSIAYTASKWAVRGMTKSAAQELAPFGIRVNSVHPGVIYTDMNAHLIPTPAMKEYVAGIPMARTGSADEVAKLVLFLSCDDSSYCTGTEFIIDGGRTAKI